MQCVSHAFEPLPDVHRISFTPKKNKRPRISTTVLSECANTTSLILAESIAGNNTSFDIKIKGLWQTALHVILINE